jgi:hypothetical protein
MSEQNIPKQDIPTDVPQSGFAAMGHSVPYYRKQAAYDLCREWGLTQGLADAITSGMALQLERDKPHEAMEIARQGLELTGAYRLMAVLLSHERAVA